MEDKNRRTHTRQELARLILDPTQDPQDTIGRLHAICQRIYGPEEAGMVVDVLTKVGSESADNPEDDETVRRVAREEMAKLLHNQQFRSRKGDSGSPHFYKEQIPYLVRLVSFYAACPEHSPGDKYRADVVSWLYQLFHCDWKNCKSSRPARFAHHNLEPSTFFRAMAHCYGPEVSWGSSLQSWHALVPHLYERLARKESKPLEWPGWEKFLPTVSLLEEPKDPKSWPQGFANSVRANQDVIAADFQKILHLCGGFEYFHEGIQSQAGLLLIVTANFSRFYQKMLEA